MWLPPRILLANGVASLCIASMHSNLPSLCAQSSLLKSTKGVPSPVLTTSLRLGP